MPTQWQCNVNMSLYYETAPFLNTDSTSGSLKSRVFGARSIKSPPNQIFALASQTSKWSPVLAEVIERAQLLQHARKVDLSGSGLFCQDAD